MFQQLTQFSLVRTPKEALGFYLAYFFLTVLLGALFGGVIGAIFFAGADMDLMWNIGVSIGTLVALSVTLILALLILRAKKLLASFPHLLLVAIAGLLALLGGGLLGLIPVAYLTTRPMQSVEA